MTSTAVEAAQGGSVLAMRGEMTGEQVELIKRTIAKGASNDELALFMAQVTRTGLDPFSRQIYCIARYDGKLKREVFQTQVSIDGARLVAQRSGEYAGQTPVYWTADGREWLEVWLDQDPPKAAKVGVYRRGFSEAIWAVATWDQYVQTYRKDNAVHVSPMWQKMGALMLGKCAEMLALRKAFPMELSGLYAPEEMSQADTEHAPPPVAEKPATTRRPAPKPAAVARDDSPPVADEEGEIADAEIVPTEVPLAQPESIRPDAITDAQVRKIGVEMRKHLPDDKTVRLAYVAAVIGREVGSVRDLSKREASAVIEALVAEGGEKPTYEPGEEPFDA